MGVFHNYLVENKIHHQITVPDRHKQMSMVESLNRQLGRLFNGYMNAKEIETKRTYHEWTDVIDVVRKELNEYRKVKMPKNASDYPYPYFNPDKDQKYKIGDVVHYKLEVPENALGHKQNTKNFRMGDYRYSPQPRKITKVIYMNDPPYYRYMLEGIPNASYGESELIPSKQRESVFRVKKIIGQRNFRGVKQYLVWWQGYKKSESTYEPATNLQEDGLQPLIDDFIKSTSKSKK
jgi:chromodomain-containing protein